PPGESAPIAAIHSARRSSRKRTFVQVKPALLAISGASMAPSGAPSKTAWCQQESRLYLPCPEPIPRPARWASFIDATSRGGVAMATLCDICHVRPATVRAEVVSNGQRETLNLCDVDYRRLARQQRSSSPLESLFGGRGSLFDDFFDDDGFFGRSAGRGRAPEADEAAAADGAARGGSS